MVYGKTLSQLIGELERLPGVGPKSAQRLAFHILRLPIEETQRLANSITEARKRVCFCENCFNLTEEPLCEMCRDPRRDTTVIAVVAGPRDVAAMERTGEFRGLYHVLHGLISPMEGIGPEQLHIDHLIERVSDQGVTEVIMATNPTVEGDTTALYLARLLKPFGPRISRIAYGMPVGGDLDYADQATVISALQFRREL
ncbi:MAG: recombination mediator RecR [bacterium]|jgi:recombination protein RecR